MGISSYPTNFLHLYVYAVDPRCNLIEHFQRDSDPCIGEHSLYLASYGSTSVLSLTQSIWNPSVASFLASPYEMKHSVAADAAFLRQHQNENSNVLELQQDSLLHLQVAALLEECGAPKRFTEQATAWAASVCSFVFEDDGDGGTAPLQFTNSALNEAHRTAPWNRSHKSNKSTQQEGKQTLFQGEDDEEATKLGHKLRILHPSKHLLDEEASLLLKASSNAHVLPTLERTVLLPCSLWRAHDYRRGRYFEVCVCAFAFACLLAVVWKRTFSSLLLLPFPTTVISS